MPLRHTSTSHAVSVRLCANQPNPNPVNPNHPLGIPPCHHVVSANLILHTMLTTIAGLSVVALVVALAAAPHLVHPVVIIITMTAAAVSPLIHATTTTLGIMIFLPILQSLFLMAELESIVVLMAPQSIA